MENENCIELVRDGSFLLTLEEIEKRAIEKALEISKTRTEAASMLGIGRSTLYRKIEEYDIDENKKRVERRKALLAKLERERKQHEQNGTLLLVA